MKYLFFTLFALSFLMSSGQLIRRDARVYAEKDGDRLFDLYDSTRVSIGEIEDGWYPVSRVALVRMENWNESDSTIAEGTVLIDEEKNEIGESVIRIKATESRKGEGRRWKKFVWIRIEGWVHSNSIHYQSIPEKGIEKIVNVKNRAGLYDKLKVYFDEHGFEKYEQEEYVAFVYMDQHKTLEEEKPYRVLVIFRGETTLFCIVTNDLPFELMKEKETREESSGNYHFTMKASPRIFDSLEDIVYSFIPL